MRINSTASTETIEQMEQIAKWLGMPEKRHQKDVIAKAVQNLHNEMELSQCPHTCEDCGHPLSFVQPPGGYVYQCDC